MCFETTVRLAEAVVKFLWKCQKKDTRQLRCVCDRTFFISRKKAQKGPSLVQRVKDNIGNKPQIFVSFGSLEQKSERE